MRVRSPITMIFTITTTLTRAMSAHMSTWMPRTVICTSAQARRVFLFRG
jgi:hypothetical protein